MGIILVPKISVLKQVKAPDKKRKSSFSGVKKDLKQVYSSFAEKVKERAKWDALCQKILSKVKLLSLKTERRSSLLLSKMRERSREKKENEKYWQELDRFSLKLKKKTKTRTKKRKKKL